ncbi:hypothetical protein TNCV_1488361 [Trichonephila clavipes]|nr:hypothetical protein TNCV_1488361 [Trichonephila clavipes]
MERNYRRFCVARKIFEPWQWGLREKREIVLNRRPELQRKISMRSAKINLLKKKNVLMPVKQCFPVEPSGCRRGAFT